MENASKALVIAGAILISILIIGLGVFIFNSASSTVKKADLTSQEAQAQNSQFEAYFGDNRSAAEVKQLCSLVRSNNISSNTAEDQKYIALSYGGAATEPNAVSTTVKDGKRYTVKVANDKASDANPFNASTGAPDISDDSAYYKTAFIRIITITEN